jgi:hypothetical protein
MNEQTPLERVIEFMELCMAEGLEFETALRLASCAFGGRQ